MLIFVILFFGFPQFSHAKISQGYLETHKNWHFLDRFCFFNGTSYFGFNVVYPKNYEVTELLLYFDDKSQWQAVYPRLNIGRDVNISDETELCKYRRGVLKQDDKRIIRLKENVNYSGCSIVDFEQNGRKESFYNCSYFRYFKTSRERWWYIAAANCESTKGLKIWYRLTMLNNRSNFLRHFSADEYYILYTDLSFLGLYGIIALSAIYQAYSLHTRHLLHSTFKLFLTSVAFEILGISILIAYYFEYARNGKAGKLIKIIGKLCEALSSLCFLLLLILIAKGFTVTRARLKSSTSSKISIFITLYSVIFVFLFFWEQQFFDPGQVLYTYESPVGYGLIALRLFALLWFTYAIVTTVRLYRSKFGFFVIFFIMFSIWFISTPILVVYATFLIPKYRREQTVNAFELFVTLRAHIFFMGLTWPWKYNKIFPYHVRTTQMAVKFLHKRRPTKTEVSLYRIDIMFKTGEAGGERIDRFTSYHYAPTTGDSSKGNDDIIIGDGYGDSGDTTKEKKTNLEFSTVLHTQNDNFDYNFNPKFNYNASMPPVA